MSVFLLVHLQISEQFMGINQPGLWNSPFDQSEAQKMFFPSSLLISADSGHHLRVLLFLYQPMRELYFLQLTNLRLGNSEMEQIYSLLTLRSRNVELWLSYNSLVAYYVDDSHLTWALSTFHFSRTRNCCVGCILVVMKSYLVMKLSLKETIS